MIRRGGRARIPSIFASRVAIVTAVVMFVLGFVASEVARAELVTFHFQGIVESVDSPLNPSISATSIFSGSYSIDSTTPDLEAADPLTGVYTLHALSVHVAGHTYSMSPAGQGFIGVVDDGGSRLYALSSDDMIGPSIGGAAPQSFSFILAGDPFTSDVFPLIPPSLGSLNNAGMLFRGVELASGFEGALTSLSLTPIPLPDALLLFAAGFLGLASLGCHRRLALERNRDKLLERCGIRF